IRIMLVTNPMYDDTSSLVASPRTPDSMMKARLWPITKYASTAPPANSGAAIATKTYAHLRSWRCRPGAMNAHSWYSHTGAPTTMPTHSAHLRRRIRVSGTLRTTQSQYCVPFGRVAIDDGRRQYGCSSRWNTHCDRMNP